MPIAVGDILASNGQVTPERILGGAPMLHGVPEQRLRTLAAAGTVHRFRQGAFLFCHGDESDAVYCVVGGRVQIESTRADGRTQLRAVLGAGQLLGELGVLAHLPRTASAIALDDCMVWRISAAAFVMFLRSEPDAAEALMRALALQIVNHEALAEDLLFLDLKGRVAKRLLALVASSWDELPDDGVALPWNITQTDLANLCGGSRENVNRVLSELQRRGLIARDGHRYVLRDIAALRRLARV